MTNKKEKRIAVVTPTHLQPTERWVNALDKATYGKADVIIVDDSNGKIKMPGRFKVFDYAKQEDELGPEMYKRFEMFHKSSSCKNFGHWYAYKEGYDYIITLDNDCIVEDGFIRLHLENLNEEVSGWVNPIEGSGWFSRGFPYSERNARPVAINMGLWDKSLDLYGSDLLKYKGKTPQLPQVQVKAASQGALPLSGMNVGMKRDVVPAFIYLPNFKNGDEFFTRHDDIWGGYIVQKIIHLKKDRLTYGHPIVEHETVVDAADDAAKEVPMIKYETAFYELVDRMIDQMEHDSSYSYKELFRNFVHEVWTLDDSVFKELIEPLEFWRDLYGY